MFRLRKKGEVSYYTIDSFEATRLVRHGFSTREGGVSKNEYSSMNLRFHCDDSRENVLENYRIFCETIGVDVNRLVLSQQVHEDVIHRVTETDCGNGIFRENAFESVDGFLCTQPGIPVATLYADCVPLLFLDPVNRVMAMSHSGWKGTVKQIGRKTVLKMMEECGSRPAHILAAIGPSIGVCHYEVSDEVAQEFRERFGDGVLEKPGENYHVNLQKANEQQFLELGIPKENITTAEICTYCNSDLLFSHRKTNGRRGNLAAVMELI